MVQTTRSPRIPAWARGLIAGLAGSIPPETHPPGNPPPVVYKTPPQPPNRLPSHTTTPLRTVPTKVPR